MIKRRAPWTPSFAVVALGIAALACTLLASAVSGPTVTILSPAPGSSALVGEPVTVEVSASDPDGSGVAEIELQLDGVTVDTFDVNVPRDDVTASLTCTPTREGASTLTVRAFREDGAASAPVTLSLNVTSSGESATTGEDSSSSAVSVQAQADVTANVRVLPGVSCQIIGQVPEDAVINLLQRTTSATEYWYQTDYLGATTLGWVYHEPLTLLGDDSALPRVPEQSCAGCGDGTCGSDEDCYTCPDDCGQCCGNTVCEDGLGETCETCEVDCGACPFCGDGLCNGDVGEDCETCADDCGACAVCGDGTCETDGGENADTCPDDCVFGDAGGWEAYHECGDGVCAGSPLEDADSCPDDCVFGDMGGSDADFECGDGVCAGSPFENSQSCPEDCTFGDMGGSE